MPRPQLTRSAPGARKPRRAIRALSTVAVLGLLSSLLALAAVTLTATPAAAQATAGSKRVTTASVDLSASTTAGDTAPSLQLAFTRSNNNCTANGTLRLFANGSSGTTKLITNYDPTPANVSNNDSIACTYTVAVTTNLADCSLQVRRNGTTAALTNNSFTLTGTDSPDHTAGTGTFADLAAASSTTNPTLELITSDCTAPSAPTLARQLQVRNLESTIRYSIDHSAFGNCTTRSTSGGLIAASGNDIAILDLNCNWQITVAPRDNIATTGCRLDAIIYHTDGTHTLISNGVFIVHRVGTAAAVNSKPVARIDLSRSNGTAQLGVCTETINLTVQVNLDAAARTQFGPEPVTFSIRPLETRQNNICTTNANITSSAAAPATVPIIKVPRGSTEACVYRLTASSSSDVLMLAGNTHSTFDFDTASSTDRTVSFRYIPRRTPVQVLLRITSPAGSIFRTDQTIPVHVSVPGACGNDTSFFGGIAASAGVSYAEFIRDGTVVVVGPGARLANSFASYSLPAFIYQGATKVPCTVRVTELDVFPGCTLESDHSTDAQGRAFIEATAADNAQVIVAVLNYRCVSTLTPDDLLPGSGRITLPAGWVALPFNGPTGTTPAAFANQLSSAVTSMWVFDPATQAWRGWQSNRPSAATLTRLTTGDTLMVFVPRARRIGFDPATLLNPPPATAAGRITLQPGYSFQTFGGSTTAQLDTLLAGQADTAPVLFRWNNATQSWSYYLPGRQQLADYPLPWFDELSPGDTVFVYNARSSAATIPWS